MTKTISLRYAKAHLSRLLDEVQQGKVLIITKRGKATARMIPCVARKPGSAIGQIVLSKNFDAPLPNTSLKSFGM